ncbi:hypothetical protein GCM10025864_35410 [Luteimicrobium album]|uniref:Uncharacterized protein n=1 Tax=Luteimicrobium album TaxID=1054550 RepID=A0ABQ6I567_9MICO|nr:hypothetical protein GCM10025864_35410 [Luteimicrobium album]
MTPIAAMKKYTGIAKNRPDSLTPRRFATASSTTSPIANGTSCPRRAGIADAAYWVPDEIDTATVRT